MALIVRSRSAETCLLGCIEDLTQKRQAKVTMERVYVLSRKGERKTASFHLYFSIATIAILQVNTLNLYSVLPKPVNSWHIME